MKKISLALALFFLTIATPSLYKENERFPASTEQVESCSNLLALFFNEDSIKPASSFSRKNQGKIDLDKFHNYLDSFVAYLGASAADSSFSKAEVLARLYTNPKNQINDDSLQAMASLFFTKRDLNEFLEIQKIHSGDQINLNSFHAEAIEVFPSRRQLQRVIGNKKVPEEMKLALKMMSNFYSSNGTMIADIFRRVESPVERAYAYGYFLYSEMGHLDQDERDILQYLIVKNLDKVVQTNTALYADMSRNIHELLSHADIQRHLDDIESEILRFRLENDLKMPEKTVISLIPVYQTDDINRGVRYLMSEEGRRPYKLEVGSDGKLYDNNGQLYDTSSAHAFHSHGKPRALFVISTDGKIYQNVAAELHKFHHSSFLAGGDVIFAGEIEVKKGVIKAISGASGHYRPHVRHFENLQNFLREKGVYSDEISFRFGY